jgi:hypothetical protein
MSTTPPTAPILTQPSDCLLMGVGRQHTGGMVIMLLRGARCRMAEEGRDDADMLGIVQRDRRGGTIAKKMRRDSMADGFLGRPQDGLPTALIAEPPVAPDPQLRDRLARQQHRPMDLKVQPKFGEQNRRPWKFQGPCILHPSLDFSRGMTALHWAPDPVVGNRMGVARYGRRHQADCCVSVGLRSS